jgi:adenylate kinase family enzyme
MKQAIENFSSKENVIFDAFIRLPWNKEIFDSYLSDYKVVFFKLSEEKAKQRLLGRMYNPKTGETFPSGTLKDPKTGDTLEKRKDDHEEGILKRIEEYVTHTLPLVEKQREE